MLFDFFLSSPPTEHSRPKELKHTEKNEEKVRGKKRADDVVRRRRKFFFFFYLFFSTVRSDSQYSEPGPISHVLDDDGGSTSSRRACVPLFSHTHTHTRTYSYISRTVIYYVHVDSDVGYVVRGSGESQPALARARVGSLSEHKGRI
jgi:hypothetical protein